MAPLQMREPVFKPFVAEPVAVRPSVVERAVPERDMADFLVAGARQAEPAADRPMIETGIPVIEAPMMAEQFFETAPPAVRDTHPELTAGVSEIEQLAEELRAVGSDARKITILGTGHNDNISLTALTLARILARHAKVVLVDLSTSSPTLEAVSNDPDAPGLAELMQGQATFGQVITKDRMSGLHMVAAGRAGADRSLFQSPRLTMALDALLRAYDHVLLDAGTAADLPAGLLTSHARAIVVPEATMAMEARKLMAEQLKAVGFADVKMLRSAPQPTDAGSATHHVVAA
jgi:Mrp family chromosome partitioning ATPase